MSGLVLQPRRNTGLLLLHSEVIGRQAGIVDLQGETGVVHGGIKHL